MNGDLALCASVHDRPEEWGSIHWTSHTAKVRKLQARIVKARQTGRHGKVKSLQWLLTHSYSATIGYQTSYFQPGKSNFRSRSPVMVYPFF